MKLQPASSRRLDANLVAHENENVVLSHIAAFGHLRVAELGPLAWPSSSVASAREMARRTLRRLQRRGDVLARSNSLGGESFVLTRKGALRAAELLDHSVRDGYDIQGVCGPTFWHRTLATAYLARRSQRGDKVWGEYSLARGWAPVSVEECARRFAKLPDGIIRWTAEAARRLGLADGVAAYEWIEVESSTKPEAAIAASLQIAGHLEEPFADGLLVGLTFVVDESESHEARIRRVAARALPVADLMSFERAADAVHIARCTLSRPLSLREVDEVSLVGRPRH